MPRSRRLDGAFQGIAFADGAQVQRHAGPAEPEGAALAIQLQVLHPDAFPRFGERLGGGHASLATPESPAVQQRSHGDVEGAPSVVVDGSAPLQEGKQLRGDGDGRLSGPGIEAAHPLAGRKRPLRIGEPPGEGFSPAARRRTGPRRREVIPTAAQGMAAAEHQAW